MNTIKVSVQVLCFSSHPPHSCSLPRCWSWRGLTCRGIDVLPLKQIKSALFGCVGPISLLTRLYWKSYSPFVERVSISRQSQDGSCAESIFNSGKRSKHNWGKSILLSRLIIHHLSLNYCLPLSFCLPQRGGGSPTMNCKQALEFHFSLWCVDKELSIVAYTYSKRLWKHGIKSARALTEREKSYFFLPAFCFTLFSQVITMTKKVACSNHATLCIWRFNPDVN